MQTINFEDAVPGKNTIVGAFKSRAALEAACEKMDPANPVYAGWADNHDVDPQSGSILTTAYNPVLLGRREEAQGRQLVVHIGEIPSSDLKFQIHPYVAHDLQETATENGPDKPVRVLEISNTRETLYFELQKQNPHISIQMATAAHNQEYEQRRNNHLQAKAPDLAGKYEFQSAWAEQDYDHVIVNAAAFYLDETGLKKLVTDIASTGARHVTFINQLRNDDPDGDPQWKVQLNDGAIQLRISGQGELSRLMNGVGYDQRNFAQSAATFDQHKASGFAAQNPLLEHFSFTLSR